MAKIWQLYLNSHIQHWHLQFKMCTIPGQIIQIKLCQNYYFFFPEDLSKNVTWPKKWVYGSVVRTNTNYIKTQIQPHPRDVTYLTHIIRQGWHLTPLAEEMNSGGVKKGGPHLFTRVTARLKAQWLGLSQST